MTNLRDSRVDQFSTKNYDLHQRRIVNAAASVDRTDYVIKKELLESLAFKELQQDLLFSGTITFKKAVSFLAKVTLSKLANFIGGIATNSITSYDNTLPLDLNADSITVTPATSLGFWGAAAATKQTLGAYTTNNQSITYAGIATGVGGIPYAQVSDVNALRVAYQNLRTMVDDLRTKVQNTTLVG